MEVTMVQRIDSKKSRIYLDQEFAFILYQKEILSCKIKEGSDLSKETYEKILKEIVLRRAKLRCVNLLKGMDRTEFQLRQKLMQGESPESIIDEAIAYVKGYRYIDDGRYARKYVECFSEKKSRQQMAQDMMKKGIPRSLVEEAFKEHGPIDEEMQIRTWIQKKKFDVHNANQKEYQKFYSFLARRGFSSESIKKVCREKFSDNE